MRELNKNAWVFEMTVDESCKNIDDIEDIIRQSNGTIIGLRGRNHVIEFLIVLDLLAMDDLITDMVVRYPGRTRFRKAKAIALLDIASMHPHSTIAECLFGVRYTKAYRDIVEGRVSIKHEAWDEVDKMLDGKLKPYIQRVKDGELTSKDLANAWRSFRKLTDLQQDMLRKKAQRSEYDRTSIRSPST